MILKKTEKLSNLSLIIITQNEQKNIERCVQSANFAAEVIIVDSGSTDKTLVIVRENRPETKIFINSDWKGFGYQKNLALSKATCNWVLSLDADEWLSDEAAQNIIAILNNQPPTVSQASLPDRLGSLSYNAENPEICGYKFTRRNLFLGRKLKSFNYWPDRILRLCKRESAYFTPDEVHETMRCKGEVKILSEEIIHNVCDSVDEFIRKNIEYLRIWSEHKAREGKRSSIPRMVFSPVYRFLRDYVYRLGFLDGILGLTLALTSSYLTFLKYALLYLENRRISR